MREDTIKRWLARSPQPAMCVAELADGSDKRIKITTGRYKWADAVRAAGDAVKLTALDADGAELRVLELDELDDELEPKAEQPRAPEERSSAELGEFRAMLAHEIPALVKAITTSVVEASRTSAEQHAAGYRGAFEALLGVVQAQGQLARSSIGDQVELLRELQAARAAAAPAPAAEPDPNDALFAMLMQQQAMGGAPTNGNGHGPHPLEFLKNIDPQILQALIARFTAAPTTPTGES